MLFLLGGAARSGKSKLSQQILTTHHVPYLSLDILKMGLVNGNVMAGLDPNDSSIVLGERVWPLLQAMSANILETGVTYLLEGDLLLPKYVAELKQKYENRLRACFLGYTEVSVTDKLRDIRKYSGHPNDWLRGQTDSEVRTLITEMIGFSCYLQEECATYQLPYIDVSRDFQSAFHTAFQSLTVQ